MEFYRTRGRRKFQLDARPGRVPQPLEAKRKPDEEEVQKLKARLVELEHWVPFRWTATGLFISWFNKRRCILDVERAISLWVGGYFQNRQSVNNSLHHCNNPHQPHSWIQLPSTFTKLSLAWQDDITAPLSGGVRTNCMWNIICVFPNHVLRQVMYIEIKNIKTFNSYRSPFLELVQGAKVSFIASSPPASILKIAILFNIHKGVTSLVHVHCAVTNLRTHLRPSSKMHLP